MFNKISIVGVGLIGGSIGLVCRKKKLAKQIVGIGRRKSSINKALKAKTIHEGTLNLKQGVKDSDLIIVSTPVAIVIKKIKECIKNTNKNTIIIDVTSIKEPIVSQIDKLVKLKEHISFVGTHPMAGSEERGVLVARPDLFEDSVCIITPSKNTNKKALKKVNRFWKLLGARIVMISPKDHDVAVACISHLPHLIAFSLCASIPKDLIKLSGSGFKDMTRIAKSDPGMWSDIFRLNKANIIKSKALFDKHIKLFQSDIAKSKNTNLLKRLRIARQKRESLD